MAYIIAENEEMIEAIKEAGYDIVWGDREGGAILTTENMSVVFVNSSIFDLLSPPLCPYCYTLMDHEAGYDPFGHSTIWYTCPKCGAEERHKRIAPDGEGL